jgi:two-component system alkaline phosphatase synthesis response regulator PhoP
MKKILLVDDEPDTLLTYSDILASGGYEVTTASSGEEATKMIDGYHPDLILLDVMMPDKNGIEVACDLAARREARDIPIVILTALSSVDGIESVPGVRRIIYKPCRPKTLLEGVDHVLRYGR